VCYEFRSFPNILSSAAIFPAVTPEKARQLNWSTQHLRGVYSLESRSPKFFSGVDLDTARSCPVGIACSRIGRSSGTASVVAEVL